MDWPAIEVPHLGTTLIIGAGVGLYVSARTGAEAAARLVNDTGFVRALFHWIPVAAVVMGAAAGGQWDLAIGIVFGTSLAALCLVLGVVALSAGEVSVGRKALFLFPAALLVVVCGFSGKLTAWHAVALAVNGLAVAAVAQRPGRPRRDVTKKEQGVAVADVVLALMLAGLTAWAANKGTAHLVAEVRQLTPGLVGSLLLGPLLMLPLLGTAQAMVTENRVNDAAGMATPIVLLNFGLLLPLAVFLAGRGKGWGEIAFPFPMVIWRVDAVILTIVSAFLLPAALGKWKLARAEGVALLIGYCLFLVTALKAGARPG